METGLRILLLTALLASLPGCAWLGHRGSNPPPSPQSVPAQSSADEAPPRVVEPEVARREIKVMFEELFRTLPDIHVASEPDLLFSAFIHGIKRMRVAWTPPGRLR